MFCEVYKSLKKEQTYLYVVKDYPLKELPEALVATMGDLEKVMDLELSLETKLAKEDVEAVMQQLTENKFYLQLPPKI